MVQGNCLDNTMILDYITRDVRRLAYMLRIGIDLQLGMELENVFGFALQQSWRTQSHDGFCRKSTLLHVFDVSLGCTVAAASPVLKEPWHPRNRKS